MPGSLSAVVRKKLNVPNRATMERRRDKALREFAFRLINRMAKYPPQLPTKYRRTGTLGRGWRAEAREDDSIDVFNRVPYAVYVEGPPQGAGPGLRQTGVMRGKNWQNIEDESQAVMKEVKGVFVTSVRILS